MPRLGFVLRVPTTNITSSKRNQVLPSWNASTSKHHSWQQVCQRHVHNTCLQLHRIRSEYASLSASTRYYGQNYQGSVLAPPTSTLFTVLPLSQYYYTSNSKGQVFHYSNTTSE